MVLISTAAGSWIYIHIVDNDVVLVGDAILDVDVGLDVDTLIYMVYNVYEVIEDLGCGYTSIWR